MNPTIKPPKFCFTSEGLKCRGQLCSDCPNGDKKKVIK